MDRQSTRPLETLTPREREVLALVAKGMTNGEIADRLGISFSTVKTHVSDILGRLGVDSREEAAAMWRADAMWRVPRPSRPNRPAWIAGPLFPVVAGGAVAGLVAIIAVAGWAAARPPQVEPRPPIVVELDSLPEDIPAKVGVYGQDHLGRDLNVWALRTGDDTAIAMLGRDPFSGCTLLKWEFLRWSEPIGRFQPDPVFRALCSGWAFTATGLVSFGAASRSLDHFVTTVSGTTVLIDLSRIILGICREDLPPAPGSCSLDGAPVIVTEPPPPVIPDWGGE